METWSIIQTVTLIVTCIVVVYYTVETYRIRRVMNSQMSESFKQTHLFRNQIESSYRPALIQTGMARPGRQAGRFLPIYNFMNTGNGPAIHVNSRIHVASKDVFQSGSKDLYVGAVIQPGKETHVDPDTFYKEMHSTFCGGPLGTPGRHQLMIVLYYESMSHTEYVTVKYFNGGAEIKERTGLLHEIQPYIDEWRNEMAEFATAKPVKEKAMTDLRERAMKEYELLIGIINRLGNARIAIKGGTLAFAATVVSVKEGVIDLKFLVILLVVILGLWISEAFYWRVSEDFKERCKEIERFFAEETDEKDFSSPRIAQYPDKRKPRAPFIKCMTHPRVSPVYVTLLLLSVGFHSYSVW